MRRFRINDRLASLIERLYLPHRIEFTEEYESFNDRRDQYATILHGGQVVENKVINSKGVKPPETGGFC